MLKLHSPKRALLLGFLVWLVPFIASFPIVSLRDSDRPLFESIMSVVLTLVCVFFTLSYFKKAEKIKAAEGIVIGLSWYLISVIIDLVLFLPESPMHMSFGDYMKDIGLTYLMIPIVTTGIGYFGEKRNA